MSSIEKLLTPDILISALRQYQHNDCSGLQTGFDYSETIKIVAILEERVDEQVEACIVRLKKELQLWLPENRMQHIEDVCRSASLTKRKVK